MSLLRPLILSTFAAALSAQAQVVSLPGNDILLAGWDFDNLPSNTSTSAVIGSAAARYSDLTGDVSASQNPAAAMGVAYFNGSFGSSTWQGGNNGARGVTGAENTLNNVIASRPVGTRLGDITGTGYVNEMVLALNPTGNPGTPDRVSFVVNASQAKGLVVSFAARTTSTGPTYTINWFAMSSRTGTPVAVGSNSISTGNTFNVYTQDFSGRTDLNGSSEAVLIAEVVQTGGGTAQLFINNLQVVGKEVSAAAAPPSITTLPSARTVAWTGTSPVNATFTVAASSNSGGTLSYLWRRNGAPLTDGPGQSGPSGTSSISGATSATLTLSNVQPADAGDYSVVVSVSTAPGSTTSTDAALVVQTPPTFSEQPTPTLAVVSGSGAKLSVAVAGSPAPALNWQRLIGSVWTNLEDAPPARIGSTTAELSLASVSPADAGRYRVLARSTLVTGVVEVTSNETVLTVVEVPAFSGTALPQAVIGQPYSASLSASGQPQSYAVTGLPSGLVLNSTTGALSGSPSVSGSFNLSLSATNAAGTGTAQTTLSVLGFPAFTSANTASGVVGAAFSYTATTAFPAALSASDLPSGLSFVPATGVLSGTLATAGSTTVQLNATNAAGTRTLALEITVLSAPVLSGPASASAALGSTFSLQISAQHAPTSFSASGLPAGLGISNSGLISGTPTQLGSFPVSITATNAIGTSQPLGLTINVTPAGLPVFTSAATAAGFVGKTFSFQVAAANSPTSFSATGLPAGLLISSSGLITGTPSSAGEFTSEVQAVNVLGTTTQNLRFTITGLPGITSASSATAIVGQPFSYRITTAQAADAFTLSPVPAGMTFSSSTGVLSGTPTTAGVLTITLGASNGAGSQSASLSLTLIDRPTFSGALTAGAIRGNAFSLQVSAVGAGLTFGATGLPTGLSIAPDTGLISGTPSVAGVFVADVSATNVAGSSFTTATITVQGAPVLGSYAKIETFTGVSLSVPAPVTTTEPFLAPTSFSAMGLPSGLSINPATGLLTGSTLQTGVFTIRVQASNGAGSSSADLTLDVAGAPVITSSASVTGGTGTPFSYTVTASGRPVSFAASGLPSGLSFDAASGVVSGAFAAAGVFTFTVSATNPAGSGSQVVTVTVAGAPVITAPSTLFGVVGRQFLYSISATGSPTSYDVSPLPAGFAVNAPTGLLSGTPAAPSRTTVTLSATNAAGTGTASVVLDFGVPPAITSASTADAIQGTPFSYQLTASGSATSTAATGLPAGLTFDPVTRRITGTSTVSGTFTVNLTAGNNYGNGTATLTLTVQARSAVITRVYERILGRAPSATELATSLPAERVALDLLGSVEYANRGFTRVFELNQALVGRSPALAQLASRARLLSASGANAVARDILASSEFAARYGDVGSIPFISNTHRNTTNTFLSTGELFRLEGLLLSNGTTRANIAVEGVAAQNGTFLPGRVRVLELHRLLVDREAPEGLAVANEALAASLLPELMRTATVVRSLSSEAMKSAGWLMESWLGSVNVDQLATTRGWVYHTEHNWVFVSPAENGLWLYDTRLGWLYAPRTGYPHVYRHSDASWYYYGGTRMGGRDFYNHRLRRWGRF